MSAEPSAKKRKRSSAAKSSNSGIESSEKSENQDIEQFKWTNDEIQLLLAVTKEYKVTQEAQNLDWLKIRNRYDYITDRFKEQYPAHSGSETYPHKVEELTRDRLTGKLKKLQHGYKKAVDNKRSGGGRVIMTFYDLCSDIWGGSPCIESMPSGIESSSLNAGKGQDNQPYQTTEASDTELSVDDTILTKTFQSNVDSPSSSSNSNESEAFNGSSESANASLVNESQTEKDNDDGSSTVKSPESRRKLIDKMLQEHKKNRLARKRARGDVDQKMLNITTKDLEFRNKIFSHMEKIDKEHTTNMIKMSTSMETLSTAIINGFATLTQILQPQQTNYNRGWYPYPDLQIQTHFLQHQPAQHQPRQPIHHQPVQHQPSQQHLQHQSPQNQHTQDKPTLLRAYNQSHYTNQSLNATDAGSYQSQITTTNLIHHNEQSSDQHFRNNSVAQDGSTTNVVSSQNEDIYSNLF